MTNPLSPAVPPPTPGITTISNKDCLACQAYPQKAGPSCLKCPSYEGPHYIQGFEGEPDADLVILADVPEVVHIMSVKDTVHKHLRFREDAAKVLKAALHNVSQGTAADPAFKEVRTAFLYAVKCVVERPDKGTIEACRTPLMDELMRMHERRVGLFTRNKLEPKPIVVLACGLTAVRSLGIHAPSFEATQGRTFDITLGTIPLHVVPTMSFTAIAASAGKFSSVMADIERALRIYAQVQVAPLSRVFLEGPGRYEYPRTNDAVTALVDRILEYPSDAVIPNWSISIDTETNTLHPHRDGLKLLLVSVAWHIHKAAAIPLWHPAVQEWCGSDYDVERAWRDVCRLLLSNKPKIGHNLGYDLKVFRKKGQLVNNVVWDCMLAEHVLEEDKKGQYSLKYLVKHHLPAYSGYEDKLHEFLDKAEGEDQTRSIRQLAEDGMIVSPLVLPERVQDALIRLGVKPGFRVPVLEARLAAWVKDAEGDHDQEIADAKLLIAAKAGGEFKAKKAKAKKEQDGGFEKIPLGELCFYACVDADVTRQLAVLQKERMLKEDKSYSEARVQRAREQSYAPKSEGLYDIQVLCTTPQPLVHLTKEMYIPRMQALMDIEYRGITVDRAYLKEAKNLLDVAVQAAERQLHEMAGEVFNLNSGPKLAKYLCHDGFGFRHPDLAAARERAEAYPKDVIVKANGCVTYSPVSRTKKTQAIQLTEKVLKLYTQKYSCPFSNTLLAYRKASKARDTFLGNVEVLSRLDGRLHTRYNLAGTSTGRLSSSNLNMQNVPKGVLGGVKCKKLFIPDDSSMAFFNADAKGAEVVVFSGYARDPALIDALRQGMDAHCFFSSEILQPEKVAAGQTGEARKLALEQAGIDDEHAWTYDDFLLGKDDRLEDKAYGKRLKVLRDNIKRVVFGMLYGAGPRKIAEVAGITEAFAKTIIELLFSKFPTIPTFINRMKWELGTFGCVETYYGRRRRFAIKNAPKSMQSRAERQAVNFMIQSTNSDIVLDVLCAIAPVIERDMGGRLLLTVHDSIGGQVKKEYVHQLPDLFQKYGTDNVAPRCPWLPVPYKWDVEVGPSYGELMSVPKYLASMPEAAMEMVNSEGYTEEEMYDDLRTAVLDAEAESSA